MAVYATLLEPEVVTIFPTLYNMIIFGELIVTVFPLTISLPCMILPRLVVYNASCMVRSRALTNGNGTALDNTPVVLISPTTI
jgi:hypothetical protein